MDFLSGSPAFQRANLYDEQAYVGLLALSSVCRISKLQNLNGDERLDSRRLYQYLVYYQLFTDIAVSRVTERVSTRRIIAGQAVVVVGYGN
jgi:hypothetical protein